jgi:protein-tyrosine phosphatase
MSRVDPSVGGFGAAEIPAAWIDLHTHILPGLDDGAQDLSQAVEMARAAQADGVGVLVATPHNLDWPADGRRPAISAGTEALNAALVAAGVAVRVLPGVEAAIAPDICQQVERGRAFGLAGTRYILVELPAEGYPLYTDQVVFELQVMGMAVILAHPERNSGIAHKPEILEGLVGRGALAQVTAASLTGAFGVAVQRTAQELLRRGLLHLIASDAHGLGHRTPILSRAVDVAGILGRERALEMVSDRPRAILCGETVEPDPPEHRPARRGLIGRIWPW